MPNLDLNFGLSALVNGAIQIAIVVVLAIILTFIGRWLVPRLIQARVPKIRKESNEQLAARTKTLSRVVIQVITVIIWVFAVVMILSQLGVDIGPLLAGLGVGALALGFAAQNIIRDYLNGFFILMEDWYRVDDWVAIVGVEGTVEEVTLRRTLLREIDGTLHNIPNNQISFSSNRTRDWGRINLSISVAYREHLDRVYVILNEVCQNLKDDPEWGDNLPTIPGVVGVGSLGDNGVDITIRGETKVGWNWALTRELRRRIKNRFDEEGIEIPWPHTKVYFGNAPGDNDDKAYSR